MPSFNAKILNYIFKKMPSNNKGGVHDYAAERAQNEKYITKKIPSCLILNKVCLNGIEGEEITPKKNIRKEVIYYIHGGGFTTGSIAQRRGVTFYLAKKYGFKVIGNNYRLCPENSWPDALTDCVTFYNELIKEVEPSNIIFMGESAGGHLVLSLALYLKDHNIPLPKAIVSFSPVVNQYERYESRTRNKDTDYMLKGEDDNKHQNETVFKDKAGDIEYLKQPYISPINGDYSGLPKIFLAASTTELLYDDSIHLYQKLVNEKHEVCLDTKDDVVHAYPMFPMLKEAKETIQKAVDFVCK